MRVARVESEVGSGMSGARPKVQRLLADPRVSVVVVEHRDRLGRVNTELAEAVLAAAGRRLVVLDGGEVTGDLVRDMVEVLTWFCARLYGRGSARNRAKKARRESTRPEDREQRAADSAVHGVATPIREPVDQEARERPHPRRKTRAAERNTTGDQGGNDRSCRPEVTMSYSLPS